MENQTYQTKWEMEWRLRLYRVYIGFRVSMKTRGNWGYIRIMEQKWKCLCRVEGLRN